jgi:hypothetical protein
MSLFSFAAFDHCLHYADYETVMQTGIARKIESGDSSRLKSNNPASELRGLSFGNPADSVKISLLGDLNH